MPEHQDVCSRYVNAKCIDPETGKPMSKVKICGGYLDSEPTVAYPELGKVSMTVSQVIDTFTLTDGPITIGGNHIIDKIILNYPSYGRDCCVRIFSGTDMLYTTTFSKEGSLILDFGGGVYFDSSVIITAQVPDCVHAVIIGRYPDSHFNKEQ